MVSTFHSIEVGKRGIVAQQTAISTTGHNITNANTPGYTRQIASMTAARPILYPGLHNKGTAPGQLGMGVEVDSIRRMRDVLLDQEYRNQNTSMNTWKVKQEALGNIEGIVNEPSENSLSKSITEFWNAWQTLSKNPSSADISARSVVQQKAIALAETFNHMASRLNVLQDNLTERINVKVEESNNYIKQVSDLTEMIRKVEASGDHANDLRDQRDLIVDKLSAIGNVKVVETPDNYQVTMGNVMIIDGINSTSISLADVPTLTGGEIQGYVESRDVFVAEYMKQLDIMANTLATGKVEVTLPKGSILPPGVVIPGAVTDPSNPRKLMEDTKYTVDGINGLHKLGYTLDNPATTGKDFFTVGNGGTGPITADNIRLNPLIVENVSNIAVSMRTEMISKPPAAPVETVIQGNGDMALLIAGLSERTFNFNPMGNNGAITNTGTYSGYFQAVVSQLGTQADHATKMSENSILLSGHADNLRQAISSVSIDEEASNLIKFQHAYSASSRVITTVDEMLDKLINGTGIVGR